MEIKLSDRKWLESITVQKLNDKKWLDSITKHSNNTDIVETKPKIDSEIRDIIRRLDKIETKRKDRKITAKITRDSFGKMESIIMESITVDENSVIAKIVRDSSGKMQSIVID